MGKFVIHPTKTGFTFHLKAANGEVIATSEVYKKKLSCLKGAASVAKCAAVAQVEDLTAETPVPQKCPKFELYTDAGGKLRFRLKASNGQVIASSQGYKSRAAALNGIESVKTNAPGAPVEEEVAE